VLKVLPSLMNTMVVRMMEGDLYESILAIQGYLSFYHLFLAFTQKYPELVEAIDSRISTFLKNEQGRIKRNCPNLGEWLPLLACSSYSWSDVAQIFIREVFDRNVKWVVIQFPELWIKHIDHHLLQY